MDDSYIKSINRVVDHIQNNLEQNITVKELSLTAGFSQFHFSRIFKSIVGETVHQFIKRLRVEKAAAMLLTGNDISVTEIALDCGFSSSSSFAKSFRQHFEISATKWMEMKKDLFNEHSYPVQIENGGITKGKGIQFKEGNYLRTVFVEDIPRIKVAYIRNIGPYEGDGDLFARLYEALFKWANPRGLTENLPYTVNIYHDYHWITKSVNHRVMASIPVPSDQKPSKDVGITDISGGKYGISRFRIYEDQFERAWHWLENIWLKESGYEKDNRETLERCYLESMDKGKRLYDVDLCIPVRISS